MNNAYVRISLETEFIPGRRLTLDGMLGGIIYQQTEDPVAATRDIPLEFTNGIPHASQVFLEAPFEQRTVMKMRSISSETLRSPQVFEHIQPKKMPPIFPGHGSGDYKNLMPSYQAYSTPAVWFLFRGDEIEVKRLLSSVQSIGSLRHKGFGWIKEKGIQTGISKSTSDLFGIVGGGKLLRPVPVEKQNMVPEDTEATSSFETWCNPYHDRTKATDCKVPVFDVMPMFRNDIARLAA